MHTGHTQCGPRIVCETCWKTIKPDEAFPEQTPVKTTSVSACCYLQVLAEIVKSHIAPPTCSVHHVAVCATSVHQLASREVVCLPQYMLKTIKNVQQQQQQRQCQNNLSIDREPNTRRSSQKPPASVQQVKLYRLRCLISCLMRFWICHTKAAGYIRVMQVQHMFLAFIHSGLVTGLPRYYQDFAACANA